MITWATTSYVFHFSHTSTRDHLSRLSVFELQMLILYLFAYPDIFGTVVQLDRHHFCLEPQNQQVSKEKNSIWVSPDCCICTPQNKVDVSSAVKVFFDPKTRRSPVQFCTWLILNMPFFKDNLTPSSTLLSNWFQHATVTNSTWLSTLNLQTMLEGMPCAYRRRRRWFYFSRPGARDTSNKPYAKFSAWNAHLPACAHRVGWEEINTSREQGRCHCWEGYTSNTNNGRAFDWMEGYSPPQKALKKQLPSYLCSLKTAEASRC